MRHLLRFTRFVEVGQRKTFHLRCKCKGNDWAMDRRHTEMNSCPVNYMLIKNLGKGEMAAWAN